MPAVSNTSPVFNLACISRFDLLRVLIQEIWIPSEVDTELEQVPDATIRERIDRARNAGWLLVRPTTEGHTEAIRATDSGRSGLTVGKIRHACRSGIRRQPFLTRRPAYPGFRLRARWPTRRSPPATDYFFQYSWILPDIFNVKVQTSRLRLLESVGCTVAS